MEKTAILEKVELFVTDKFINEISDKFVYHDIKHLHTVEKAARKIATSEKVTKDDLEIVLIAVWFNFLGFLDFDSFKKTSDPAEIFKSCHKCSIAMAIQFLEQQQYPKEKIEKVQETIREGNPHGSPDYPLANILSDAITIDFSKSKAKKRLKLLYEEFLLLGVINFGKKGWYEASIGYLQNLKYRTNYGKQKLEPSKNELILTLEKEFKRIRSKNSW